MRSKNVTVWLAIAVITGTANADFVLWDNEYLNVTTTHSQGFLYNSSSADIQTGGSVSSIYVNDDARLNLVGGRVMVQFKAYNNSQVTITDGSVENDSKAYNNSKVTISGGYVKYLGAYGSSQTGISGGEMNTFSGYNNAKIAVSGGAVDSLSASQNSQVEVSNGSVGSLYGQHYSKITISGGSVNSLSASDESQVIISDGYVGDLHVDDIAQITISAGSINSLYASNNGTITLHGNNFRVADGVSFVGNEVIGTGSLIGRWLDGTSFIITIAENYETATILAVSEPFIEPVCTEPIVGDLNDDCRVDFVDLARMAENWMTCNLEPQSACWE